MRRSERSYAVPPSVTLHVSRASLFRVGSKEKIAVKVGPNSVMRPVLPIRLQAKASITLCGRLNYSLKATWLDSHLITSDAGRKTLELSYEGQLRCGNDFTAIFLGRPLPNG